MKPADLEARAVVVERPDQPRAVRPLASRLAARSRELIQGPLAPYLAISVGGALGANARFVVSQLGTSLWGSDFPWATLFINVSGSLIIGFYLGLATERFAGRPATRLLVTTGFCGAYTTLSTFSVETLALLQGGEVAAALAYVIASVVFSILAAAIGILAAHAM